jgi:hypothetical protein
MPGRWNFARHSPEDHHVVGDWDCHGRTNRAHANSAHPGKGQTRSSKRGKSLPDYAAAPGAPGRSPRPSSFCKLTRPKQDEKGSLGAARIDSFSSGPCFARVPIIASMGSSVGGSQGSPVAFEAQIVELPQRADRSNGGGSVGCQLKAADCGARTGGTLPRLTIDAKSSYSANKLLGSNCLH